MYAMHTFHVILTFEANKISTMITNVLPMPLEMKPYKPSFSGLIVPQHTLNNLYHILAQ
jgi:hypothetical protein